MSNKRKREWTEAFQEVLDEREHKKRRLERLQLQAKRLGYVVASNTLLLAAFGAGALAGLQLFSTLVHETMYSVMIATSSFMVATTSAYFGRRTNRIQKSIKDKLKLPDFENNETLKESWSLFHSDLRAFFEQVEDEMRVFKRPEVFESEFESLVQQQGAQKVIEMLGADLGPVICAKYPAICPVIARKLASEINEKKGEDALADRMKIISKIFDPKDTREDNYSWIWEPLVAQRGLEEQQKDDLCAKIENGLVRFLNENCQRLDILEKAMNALGWEVAGEKFPSVSLGFDNAMEHFHSYMCSEGPLSAALSLFGEDAILRHADTRPDLPGQIIARLIDESKECDAIEDFVTKQGYIFAKENQKLPPELSGRLQGWLQKQEDIKKAFKAEIEKLLLEEKEAVKDLDNSLNELPAAEASEAAALDEEFEASLKNVIKEEEQALSRMKTSQVAELFGVVEGSSEHDRIVNKYDEELTKIQRSFRGKKITIEKELEFKKAQLKDQFKKKATAAKNQLSKNKQSLASKMFDRKGKVAKKRDADLVEVDKLWRQWRDEYALRIAESSPTYVDTRSPGSYSSVGTTAVAGDSQYYLLQPPPVHSVMNDQLLLNSMLVTDDSPIHPPPQYEG